jgi:predicted nucleotidyltransferase
VDAGTGKQAMYLDRDFLETPEGFLFCVVGCIHPRDRAIAYLKYVQNPDGKWGSGSRRFRRTMDAYTVPQVLDNVEMLRARFPEYVFNSRVLNIVISAVPKRRVVGHFRPRERLSGLLASSQRDELEHDVAAFVTTLSRESGVKLECFGVTGSILTRIHNIGFSDMDITVYGSDHAAKVKATIIQEYRQNDSDIKLPEGQNRSRMLERWRKHYSLSQVELAWFAERKWNRGTYAGRAFSLLPIHLPGEVAEKYGRRLYRPQGIVEGEAIIESAHESLFLPCRYTLQDRGTGGVTDVEEITSYDGFYCGIFKRGDIVRYRGKLENVLDKDTGTETWRILIGSPEARGLDYMRPKLV